ncbi:MAG: PKD domain-containing protein, partial [Bacteroidales bacterium]|nr:PKD domain-containing protein [Bacteroidales bacterium]
QNIELLDIEKTKEQMPYDTIMHHRISLDTEERIAVNVHNDYKAEYFGHILFEGRELEFYANIIGDKKFIKAIFLFEPGTKDTLYEDNNKNLLYNIWINDDNYNYENNDRSDLRNNGIYLYLNGSNEAVSGIAQGENVVYYYPENSTDVLLRIPSSYVENMYKVDVKIESVGSTNVESITVLEIPETYYPGGAKVNITGLQSGFYKIRYRKHNVGNYVNLPNVYLVPESYSYKTLEATGQTMKYSYLKQMYEFNNAQALEYVGYVNNRFNEVCTKYITDQLILANQFVDDDGTIVTCITNPSSNNYPTYYRTKLTTSSQAGTIVTLGENDVGFAFRANNQNLSNFNSYGSENNALAHIVAHEAFHWITRSLNPVFFYGTTIGNVDFSWMDEGLSTMSQAYCYPEIELQTNSDFIKKCNSYIENSNEKNTGIFYINSLNDLSPYYRGIFFYYLATQQDLGIIYIKNLLTNFNMIADVNTSNYPDKLKLLFDYSNTQMPNSGFSSSDQILASFTAQFVAKQFLSNLLNYNNQDLGQLAFSTGNGSYDFLIPKYSSIISHVETASDVGQMNINLQIRQESGQYGNFYCAVGAWDNNNNLVESSFQEFYLNQDVYAWNPVVEVGQGYKVMAVLLKLNDPAIIESSTYFLDMNYSTEGEELNCDFCSNLEFTNYSNIPRVEIAAQNYVQFYPTESGEGLSYSWNFSGGSPSTSTELSPVIYYATQGHFDVSLTVTDIYGETCYVEKEEYVQVWPADKPVASFTVNGSTIVNPGEPVEFINTSFNSSTYDWSFNGGTPNSSQEINPIIRYYEDGIYSVGLRAYLGEMSHGITKTNYITVLNPNNLVINCVTDELVMPNEPVYTTVHLEAVQDDNVYYTYVFDFGDGFVNEIYTNEIWVSSDWHSYNFTDDYYHTVTVFNSQNSIVAACQNIISVRDMFQPVYVNLTCDPETPVLGHDFTINVETDAIGQVIYNWFSNGVQFAHCNSDLTHNISQSGTYTYKVVVMDGSNRPAGEDEITLTFEDPGNCIVASIDWENSCFQYGEPMYVKSTSYCSNSDECFSYNGNNMLNQITDIRWTLVKSGYNLSCIGQSYNDLQATPTENYCNFIIPNSSANYFLVIEVWNRNAYSINENNAIMNNSEIYQYEWDHILLSNDHINNPYYDKKWFWLEPSGTGYNGTKYLCGWHPSNKTYTNNKIFAANHNGCSFEVASDENIKLFAIEEITLRSGFSAKVNSNFCAKLGCGSSLVRTTAPSFSEPLLSQFWDWLNGSGNGDLLVYPNPCNEIFEIVINNYSLDEESSISINIYTSEGKLVKTIDSFYKSPISIDISDLPPSAYQLQIQVDDSFFKKQIIKQ